MNPILPLEDHIPDVEARVFSDGKIYLYGSCDIVGHTEYCSKEYYVFSSGDFLQWQKSDVCFDARFEEYPAPLGAGMLYAPDCIEKNGRYYLYFCMEDGTEGVAESLEPTGPFVKARPIEGADKKGIDPAVFVDDDGQAYYYWGQFHLHGAKLTETMDQVILESLQDNLLDEQNHGFHEGASLRKYNGTYYLLYTDISRGKATCISYAVSQSPLGPFTKGGVIIDNIGCDPAVWNNHGSMACIQGQWYVFYHRSTLGSKFSRRVCAEPIYFDQQGNIREVPMSLKGQEYFLPASEKLAASRASRLSGKVYVQSYYEDGGYQECLSNIHSGDWCEYRSLTFSGQKTCFIEAGSGAYGGIVEIHINAPEGELIGQIQVNRTGRWQQFEAFSGPIKSVSGEHVLYLVCQGETGRLFDLKAIWFK